MPHILYILIFYQPFNPFIKTLDFTLIFVLWNNPNSWWTNICWWVSNPLHFPQNFMSPLLNGTFGRGVLVPSLFQNFKNRPSSFHLNLKKSSPSSLVSGTNRDEDRPRNICPVPRTPATDTDSELDSIKSTASNNLKIDQNFWSKKTKIRTHGHEALREIQ